MNASDILRTLLDKLDQIENSDSDVLSNNEVEDNNNEKMMPPLQQKQELLKKAVGVESEYDQECEYDDTYDIDIDELRKNAGIQDISIHYLSDDEPLEQ